MLVNEVLQGECDPRTEGGLEGRAAWVALILKKTLDKCLNLYQQNFKNVINSLFHKMNENNARKLF